MRFAVKVGQIWAHKAAPKHKVKILRYKAGTVSFEVIGKKRLCGYLLVAAFRERFRLSSLLEEFLDGE